MYDVLRIGLRGMFRSRSRVLMTIIGIAVGVMSVMIVSSIGQIGKDLINKELSGMGMDSLVVSAVSDSAGKLTETELEKIRNIGSVENAMPLMSIVTKGEMGGSEMTCMAWGVDQNADNVIDLEVRHGRLLNRGDVAERNRVCVIDEAIALDRYKRGNIVGKKIMLYIGGIPMEFEIVGVVKNGVNTLQTMLGGFIPDFVYIPYTVMQEYSAADSFDRITVRLNDPSLSDPAAKEVKKVLSLGTGYKYSVDDLISRKDKMNNILSIASTALSAVAGISLIVSGLSIMTVMLVSVSERTREIGIKKSIGAGRGTIMLEFLFESAAITFLGSVIGILLGTAISVIIDLVTSSGLYIDFGLCFTILIISLFIGGIFGAYPAYKAASLKPADALRCK